MPTANLLFVFAAVHHLASPANQATTRRLHVKNNLNLFLHSLAIGDQQAVPQSDMTANRVKRQTFV